ncbi:MAG TPA: NAD(P)/FAD-dependent oxidoreductase [Stellaceae bacterium]|nr:NAD(P)/FAD-dependent oxidoreductase [Stellaceae bacterium]
MQRSLAVIGAGPAGMAAAIEAVRRGCRVTIIDEAVRPGGQIFRQAHPALRGEEFAEPAELARKHRLLAEFQGVSSKIDYRGEASVYAVFPNGEIHLAQGDATEVLRPDAIILATGVREQVIPFPGWTTPGVMFAGGAQSILKAHRVVPGTNVVIAGCGPLPLIVAAQILRAGGRVAALASLRSLSAMLHHVRGLWHGREIVREGLRYAWTVRRAKVPLLTGYMPVRAIGTERLEAVVLARVDQEGRLLSGSERRIDCDLLAINYGFVANSELAAMAGSEMRRDPVAGGWIPVTDTYGRTSVPGVFVAGDGAGLRGALVAECDGTIVGAAAAMPSSAVDGPTLRAELADAMARRARHLEFQKAVRATLQLPIALWRTVTDETIVCRCENVRFGEIRGALEGGHHSLNAIKRNVRSGMGWCGGRSCLHSVAALTELATGAAPTEMMTPRPMVRPVSFAAIARQRKVEAR